MFYFKYYIILILSILIISCNKKAESDNKNLIDSAVEVMESNPKQALALLKQIKTEQLNESEYNYFILIQTQAWDKVGMDIKLSEDAINSANNYFVNKKEASNASFSYYLLGKIYASKNNMVKSLHYFQLADEWAKVINYKNKNIPYYIIPYNVATLLFYKKNFKESDDYLNRSIEFVYNEYNKQSIFELKATNFQKLANIDSSLIYYDKALQIANINNDTVAKNRINYNKCALYLTANDYSLVEQNCRTAILHTSPTDSINLGRLYLTQAAIYEKTNKADSAYTAVFKAKNLLKNPDYPTQQTFLQILSKIEKRRKNPNKAEEYKKQYFALKTEQENAQNLEKEELRAEIAKQKELLQAKEITKTLSFIKSNWLLGQKYRANIKTVAVIIVFLTIALAFSLYRLLKTKRHDKEIADIRKLGKETILRNILQRKDLIALLEKLDEYIYNNKPFTKDDLEQLADKVDEMIPQAYWDDNPAFFRVHFRTMFERFKNDFPMLNELEYRVLCLLCTQLFTPSEMAAVLRIGHEEFKAARKTMEEKLTTKGYKLHDLMIYAQATFKVTSDNDAAGKFKTVSS